MLSLPAEITALEKNVDVLRFLVEQSNVPKGLVPFVGSGFSIAAGLPSWHDFVRSQAANAGIASELTEEFEAGEYRRSVTRVMEAMTRLAFYDALRNTYGSNQLISRSPQGGVTILPDLTHDLFVTTSIDRLLEIVFERAGQPFEHVYCGAEVREAWVPIPDTYNQVHVATVGYDGRPLGTSGKMLFKLVGDADRYGSLILTDQGIPNGFTNAVISRRLIDLMRGRSFLFIALNLYDPFVTGILDKLVQQDPLIGHFALVSQPNDEKILVETSKFLYEHNVRPIWYPAGQHDYVDQILAYLREQKLQAVASTDTTAKSTALQSPVQPSVIKVPELPQELVKACVEGDCAVYLGSGISAPAAMPTWKPLVQELVEWADLNGFISSEYTQDLHEALRMGQVDSVADSVISQLSDPGEAISVQLRRLFIKPEVSLPSTFATLRTIPFCAALTTNFDDLLERSYREAGQEVPVYTPHDAEELLEAYQKRLFFLLKLYGTVERPDTLLVAPKQYEEMTADNLRFGNFIEAMFLSRTLLFLGASLEGIEAYLSGIRFKSNPTRKHFALVNVENGAWRVKADLLERRYGIKVLAYQATEGFPEVADFLHRLQVAVAERRMAGVSGTSDDRNGAMAERAPARLKRLTLENIGPFDKLEIDLDAHWQVLLGDNGVGKSSVLKAIATAVCGENARSYANRIIRHNQPNAQIILETDRGTRYVTQLLSNDVQAEVISRPVRCLEAEGWLVLAFPPLRSLTWARTPEETRRQRPTTEDVLPLLRGDLDTRLDSLKQQLLTLDSMINEDLARGQSESSYAQQRDQLFAVIRRVTPGMNIEYAAVDHASRQVTLRINGESVPMETISQGTSSLLSWIGVLMQRLYDVYRGQGDPLERYALVLIDEIDAHMHPFWQQFIVPAIQQTFPNVQFIATTHSPLVVNDLAVQQVSVLDRDPDTGKVVVKHREEYGAQEDFSHLRADQVLTSPVFGLQSTRGTRYEQAKTRFARLLGDVAQMRQRHAELTGEEQEELERAQLELDELREYIAKARTDLDMGVGNGHSDMEERQMSAILPVQESPLLSPEDREEIALKLNALLDLPEIKE